MVTCYEEWSWKIILFYAINLLILPMNMNIDHWKNLYKRSLDKRDKYLSDQEGKVHFD